MEEIRIPVDFADNRIFKAKPEYAMVYLYAYRHKTPDSCITAEDISEALNIPLHTVNEAMDYWTKLGYDIFTLKKFPPKPEKSRYSPNEITEFLKNDHELALLYEEASKLLGKALSSNDCQTLFWIYNDLGMSSTVIMLIINYAKSINKCRIRYIEKIAMEWSEKGIVTFDDANKYIEELERTQTYEERIKRLFGIERSLTTSEKEVIAGWCNDLKPTRESLVKAYEICIERTGKFSAKYINAVLINRRDSSQKLQSNHSVSTPRPTKFNNFTQKSDIDYKKFEMDALKKRMSKKRGEKQ